VLALSVDMRIKSIGTLLGLAIGLAAAANGGELDRTFPAAGGGTLRIALDFGSVAVQTHEGSEIRLEAVSRGIGASGVHFDAHVEGRDVVLTGAAEPWLGWLHSSPGVRVRAWVPRTCAVQIRSLGPIEVERGGHPQVQLSH
jgi:hypothetical protein